MTSRKGSRTGAFLIGLSLWLAAGCGGRPPAGDTAPFQAAVDAYLRSQSMDMKATRFRRLEVSGETATATVSLAHADGAAGVSVQWDFTFARRGETWTVTGVQRR